MLGIGNIGKGTYQTLEMSRTKIEQSTGMSLEIVKILNRHPEIDRGIDIPKEKYVTDAYDIILDQDTLDYVRIADDYNTDFPETAPIHTYNNKQLNVLRGLGIIDELIEEHFGDNHYKYLNYLGGLSIDLYSARIAANWDILYIPNCENLVLILIMILKIRM